MTEPNDPAELPTPDDVRGILRGVMDPELHVSIVELGMVKDVTITPAGAVNVGVALTTAGCPLRAEIKRDVQSKVAGLRGVTEVSVSYSEMTQTEKSALMATARRAARDRAPDTEIPATTRVLAIASGKGGVGKSSVTVNLAAALASRGLTVGVLDADIWGFSVPRMLGVSGRLGGDDGKINPNTVSIPNRLDPDAPPGTCKVVSMGFLVDQPDTALMWRGLILAKAVEQFLTDVRWGELDYLLVDMPPGTGDIQMALARLLPQAEMVVVTTPALAAQEVATRVADMAARSYMKVAGVIENMATFVAPSGESFAIFGTGGGAALAQRTGAPLLGSVPIEPSLAAGGDVGTPVVLGDPDTPAARALLAIADDIVARVLPPVAMEGCTARMLAAVEAALPPIER